VLCAGGGYGDKLAAELLGLRKRRHDLVELIRQQLVLVRR
jgi:hypothetical protein